MDHNKQLERHMFAVSRAMGMSYYRDRRHVDGVAELSSEYIVTGSRFGSESRLCDVMGHVRVMASVM